MPSFTTGQPQQGGTIILAPGEYPFEVTNCEAKTSKAGNPMFELKLRVGDKASVYDNLVFTQAAFWKIDQFLRAVGAHPGEGQSIDLEADDCIGHKGRVKIRTGKTASGNDRNEVESYTWEDTF